MSVIKRDMTSDLEIKCSTNLQKVTSVSLYDNNSAVSEELDFEDYKDQSNQSLLKSTADKVEKDHNYVEQNSTAMESNSIGKTDTTDVISVIDGEILDDGDFDDHNSTEQDLRAKQINITEKLEAESVFDADGEILDDRDSDENSSIKRDLETMENSNIRKSNVSDTTSDADGEFLDDREINDIEEGEIKENSPDSPSNFVCRFFQEGRCRWGTQCRFMHVTDKGLYNMFDEPSDKSSLTVPSNKSSLDLYPLNTGVTCNTGVCFSNFSKDVPICESAWDKALSQAKEIIEKSKKRKEDKDFEEKKLYLSPEKNKTQNGSSYNKKHSSRTSNFNSEQEKINVARAQNKRYRKELSVQAYGSKFKKQEYRKPFNKNAIRRTDHFTWRDPWRRSKSPKFRKFSASRSPSLSSSSSSVCSYSVTSYSSSRCTGSSCRSYSRSPVRSRRKELYHKIKRSRSPRKYRDRRSLSKSRMLSRYKSRWSSSSKSSICSKKTDNSSNNRHSFSAAPQKKRKISQTRAPSVQNSPKTCSFYDSDSEIHSPSNSCRAVFSASACYSSDMSISPISSHSISPLRQNKNFENRLERCIRVNDKNLQHNDKNLQRNDLIISANDTSFKNKISSHNESKQTKLLKLNVQLDVNTFSSRKAAESEYMPKKIPAVCTEWIRTVRREVAKPTDKKTLLFKESSESSVPRKAKPIDIGGVETVKYQTRTNNKRPSNNTANDDIPSNTLRLLNEAFSKSISQLKFSKTVQKTNVIKKPNESEREIKISQLSTQSIRNPKKSKREELLRQLKAIEEAIARKKGQ
ncbi:zinc finger CCCH domain-containing protein 18-like [Stegodyphus dumicola]|uniref:zinc finger CCCH domain-containing protein 18-like n=1 Tax=Stegodyphus dumicola TaxID=202533 RepID=UPI0015AEFDC5|nr:zinc finger CCCH domain-containing protein 18-like [Stegodyphus dumicola]XP_035212862.1 zinc finger CCCH domain-containing protein 18-like [Stegodyphus dumicola]XP_035212869.1 zinc finger CCCH domain-containing protein 18-like [Stegodyphus dumicola]